MTIRKPIITVMGHVDAGKTKILDSIRGTSVAEKEAGGITQHIGATQVPTKVIEKVAGKLLEQYKFELKIPGLMFIDTPGHEAFTTLRKRGGSIADLAVLVVDVHKGLQEQTKEAIEILKSYKTPFIVAMNKVDTIHGWTLTQGESITDALKNQREHVLEQLDVKVYELVGQLHSKGYQSERFDRIKDFTKEIIIVPVSAKNRVGIQELLMFLAGLSQKYLEKKLEVHETEAVKGTVLEVKEDKGLGKTIDVIIYDGMLSVGEEIIVGGKNGIIRTKIRALLEPNPVGEGKPGEKYRNVKEVHAAAGVKISAPNLDEAISGSPIRHYSEQAEKEIAQEIQSIKIDSDSVGPIVRSNTLGSLEAIIKLLEDRNLKVSKADVGEIPRKDVLQIESVKEKDRFKGVIFAFHTKVSDAAKVEAEKRGVKIFESDVVYRLLQDYEEWVKNEKEAEKQAKLSSVVMPVKFVVLQNHVFRNSGPAVVGVRVLVGKLQKGIRVLNKGKEIGKVQGIQSEGKAIDEATKNMEVAVSIQGGIVEKNLHEKDELYGYVPDKDLEKLESIIDSFTDEEAELIRELKRAQHKEVEA
ncbi:MAG TPA: translation initiation factor IF-2 [archaeon]|nr:translation initiation factor IF-2 [archaeon]